MHLQHSFYFINPCSHFLQQCHNEDWPISDSISPLLKKPLWTVYLKNYMDRGAVLYLGTYFYRKVFPGSELM